MEEVFKYRVGKFQHGYGSVLVSVTWHVQLKGNICPQIINMKPRIKKKSHLYTLVTDKKITIINVEK